MPDLPDLQPLWDLWANGSASGIRQRLMRYVQGKFPWFSRDMAEDAVAEAADRAVETLRSGKEIRQLTSWLYKVSFNIACDRASEMEKAGLRSGDIEQWQRASRSTDDELAERDRRASATREALGHARQLLPRLGTGQVRDVMDLFLEAVANGVPHYPPSEIAAVLGITTPQARTLLDRGLERLRAQAENEGVRLPKELFEPEDPTHTEDRRESA